MVASQATNACPIMERKLQVAESLESSFVMEKNLWRVKLSYGIQQGHQKSMKK